LASFARIDGQNGRARAASDAGEAGTPVAVLGFWQETGKRADIGDVLPELLAGDLTESGQLLVLERARVSTVLQESGIRASGLVDKDSQKNVGTALGAAVCIAGRYGSAPGRLWVPCHILDVRQRGKTQVVEVERADDDVFGLSHDLARRIVALLAGPETQGPRKAVVLQPSEQNYTLAVFEFQAYGGEEDRVLAAALGDLFVLDVQDIGPFALVDRALGLRRRVRPGRV